MAKSKTSRGKSTKSKSKAKSKSKKKAGKTGKSKKSKSPSVAELRDSADGARNWLAEREDYYGYLARRRMGRGAPELASHLRGDLMARQQEEGFWAEPEVGEPDFQFTVESLWQLMELGMGRGARAVEDGVTWILGTRGREGAFGEGTALDHTLGSAPGVSGGFFSPADPEEALEVTLSNGQTLSSDASARLLLSERALRVILRLNPIDGRADQSVAALRAVPLYLEYGGTFTPAVLVGAVQALAWTPRPYTSEVIAGLETLRDAQEKDGTWSNVEFFFVLEMLLEVKHPLALRLMETAVKRLLETQYKNGSWGRSYSPEQTWIGLQVLERVIKEMTKM